MATPTALFNELGNHPDQVNDKNLLKLQDFKRSGGNTVKALSFHPKRPWILAGFVSGMIEILDYSADNVIDQFEGGHNGEVRTVNFHLSCPLFVSGGYDGKIKLWDYDEMFGLTSTFSLEGHNAGVNDVQFHHELPWLVSASDDCTVRLWNWSSREPIAIFIQHTGAVTSSSFHSKLDLILSSSLDRKLCVWDIGGLRYCPPPTVNDSKKSKRRHWLTSLCGKLLKKKKYGARLKHILNGHMSGAVRAIFHPTLPFIFSSSNDCSVYWWTVQDTIGYCNNYRALHLLTQGISCLAYSLKLNTVMSTPDGENVFVCNAISTSTYEKCFGVLSINKKNISNISSHPTNTVFAVGHSDGITVYRHEQEPPAFSVVNDVLYYVKNKQLKSYDYSTNKQGQVVVGPMEELPNPTFWPIAVALSCSPQGDAALVSVDRKTYRLISLSVNSNKKKKNAAVPEPGEKGYGLSAVFVAPDRIAVLVRVGTAANNKNILSLRNLENQIVSESLLPFEADALSYHPVLDKYLLCRGADKVIMFDPHQNTVVSELGIGSVRNVFWAGGGRKAVVVALVGYHFITMVDEKLRQLRTVEEEYSIESGAWDEENNGIFIYKTWKSIKYCLVNGETGIIMPFDQPLFITRVSGSTIFCLDEDGEVRAINVDMTECVIKSSIMNKDYLKQCSLCSC